MSKKLQKENRDGLADQNNRYLNLVIGINPTEFELFCDAMREVGNLLSDKVVKNDKTNEYREMQTRRATLENAKKTLIGLQSKGGDIPDYITLEKEIRLIDQQLQQLGVQLGDFDSENEFCTVELTLEETTPIIPVSLLPTLFTALIWALGICTWISVTLFFFSLFIYITLLITNLIIGFVEKRKKS